MIFKHYLNFLDYPSIGKIEISEPFGFDASSHKIKQEDFWGRDVYISDEETEFEFTRQQFEELALNQQLINGVEVNHATHGFDYLLSLFNDLGWNSRVEYIIEKDGIEFSKGIFDYFTAIIKYDSITFKVIQDTNREKCKRNEDVVVNAFSDKDIDGNDIEPCSTVNVLLKAKPVVQKSIWENETTTIFNGLALDRFNPFLNLTTYEIDDSLVSFDNRIDTNITEAINNFRYIEARTQLTSGKIKFTIKGTLKYRPNGSASTSGVFVLNMYKYVFPYVTGADLETINIYTKSFSGSANQDFILDLDFEVDMPNLLSGEGLSIFWTDIFTSSVAILNMGAEFTNYKMEIKATSTSIDSVIKASRFIDVLKHNVKSISSLPTIAPLYDVGGEHYDNFATNGYLIGQKTDKPFNNKFKDLCDVVKEQCVGKQINTDSVEFLHYSDFYTNEELAVFDELPDYEQKTTFNKDYFIKTFEFSYKNSSKDRETNGENTLDDVHGQTQWLMPTPFGQGRLKVELDHIRSAFLLEEQRRRIFEAKDTESLQYDDKLFLIKCRQAPPSLTNSFSDNIKQQRTGVTLKLLSNNFRWDLLGFNQFSTITIDGNNAGTYSIIEITPSLLTLVGISVNPFSGESIIKITYNLNNIDYIVETAEDFAEISGIENSNNYANLRYSIKRNIKNWYNILSTASIFDKDKEIKNTMFEVNGNLSSRLITETEAVVDNASILTDDILDYKILSPKVHDVTVFCEFEKATQLIKDVNDKKGFVRVRLNSGNIIKGYIKELDYGWKDETLDLTLLEKYEKNVLKITTTDTSIFLNDYEINLKNFVVNDIFVILFDENDVAINNAKDFKYITINGVEYTDINEFSDDLAWIIASLD